MKNKNTKAIGIDLLSLYSESLDDISKRQGFESSSLDVAPPISSGLLAVDLMLGGGIRPCMMTGVAQEQGGKTTLALTAMGAAIKANIPIIAFADFEGSTKNSKPYVQSILSGMGVKLTIDEVFGKKDADGKWVNVPRVRYRSETILERFYDWLSEILRELPDKKFVENRWWLVFDDTKKNKAKVGEFVDANMVRKYGNGLWVPAPDDKIQGLVIVDSYTAMQPEVKDEESIGNQLSVKASAFSKQLERVKGRMVNKMVTVYGLNHMRDNPMAMFGPKESEKGGNALKQFSDVRIKHTSRALSFAPFSPKAGKDFNEWEASVEHKGTHDKFRYVALKTIKNKLWTPQREVTIRLWVEDGAGVARGIDPVFDTIYYLQQTGQLSGTRKKFKLNLAGLGQAKNPVTWEDLKTWVLGNKEQMKKISSTAGFKPMSLRAFCFRQLEKGVGEELYITTKNAKVKVEEAED
jgi:RecA/RadA recombinase